MGFLYLVQRRHGAIRVVEALSLGLVTTTLKDGLVFLVCYAVWVVKTFVDRGVDRPTEEITGALSRLVLAT